MERYHFSCADPVRNKQMNLKVVSPHMIDPKGERMYA